MSKIERGLFIVLEGIDNCGKTTQSELLEKYLKERGLQVVRTREPGGTEVGEEVRDVLLRNRSQLMEPITQTLLFYAARQEFINNVVRPNLGKGIIVLSDRFEASTYVYQGLVQGVDTTFIEGLHKQVVVASGCVPDLYIILDITTEESLRREQNPNNQGQQFIYERQGIIFRRKLREGYKSYAREHKSENVYLVNGMRGEDDIQEGIRDLVDKRLGI